MNQQDKDAFIKSASAEAIKAVATALKIKPTLASVTPAVEYAMGSDTVKLCKVSLQFGIEADKCFEQGAYFASCLLTAASIEAFLTLLCLQEEQSVSNTATYRNVKKPSKTFKEAIAEFNLDRAIKVSTELHWITRDVVNEDLLQIGDDRFPEVRRDRIPEVDFFTNTRKA